MKKFICYILFLSLLIPSFIVSASENIITKGFSVAPLPYEYDALEPYIDKETMMIHHDKHYKSYVDNLNKALKKYPELYKKSLPELLGNIKSLPQEIQVPVANNGGGDYNHTFFFSIMAPGKGGTPTGELLNAINRDFGSFDNFKAEFDKSALGRFGSGWAYLLADGNGKLTIQSLPNQSTPIDLKLSPIITIDVWEHAYYLKYQNRRNEYISNWWNVVNWDKAQEYYKQSIK